MRDTVPPAAVDGRAMIALRHGRVPLLAIGGKQRFPRHGHAAVAGEGKQDGRAAAFERARAARDFARGVDAEVCGK